MTSDVYPDTHAHTYRLTNQPNAVPQLQRQEGPADTQISTAPLDVMRWATWHHGEQLYTNGHARV